MDQETVNLFAGDSLVHAIESLLSKLSNSDSEPYALAAAETFVTAADDEQSDRVALMIASMNAARAFDVTKLGLAHALSRPLGIAAGISHDGFNLMLGPPVIDYWGSSIIGESPLRRVTRVEPTAAAWSALVDGYRRRAALPDALRDAGVTPADVDAALDWAPHSSGIPNLPKPLEPGDLQRIMQTAWEGTMTPARGSTVSA
jgi:alcohol dehydrogenase